VTFINNQY